jgi:hypothetical protein
MSETPAYMRWTPDREWLIVGAIAAEHLARGKSRFEALKRAQMALPKHRRRSLAELHKLAASAQKSLNNAIARAKAMPPEQLAQLMPAVPPQAPPKIQSKPPAEKEPRHLIKWSSEQLALMARRIDHIEVTRKDERLSLVRLFLEAQTIELTPEYRRSNMAVHHLARRRLPEFLDEGRKYAPLIVDVPFVPGARTYAEAHPQSPGLVEPPAPTVEALREGLIRWNDLELAQMVRRIDELQSEPMHAGRALSSLFIKAQAIELPPERRRPHASLYVNSSKFLPLYIQRGRAAAHLVEHIPFVPRAVTYAQAYPKAQPIPPAPQEPAQAIAAPAPTPAPEKTILQPADALAAAPAAPASSASDPHQMATWAGISLANALVPIIETLLVAGQNAVIERVRAQAIEEHKQLAADMSRLMLEGLDRMLGGQGIAHMPAPVPEEPIAPPAAAPESPPRVRVKFDVIGFIEGKHEMLVQHGLNGHSQEVDLRFVSPRAHSTYSPQRDRIAILLTSRIPHALQDKVKASGCEYVFAKRTVSDVLTAINTVLKERAIHAAH